MNVIPGSLSPGLIINADDLGVHPDTNAGIASAYRNGVLTSSTMLMTTPYLEQTVREFVRPALLPIGVHLSLTQGKAAAPVRDVPDLVDDQGNLALSAGRLICTRFKQGDALLAQIRREFECQLALARDWGLKPTHADSHQHVHMNQAIFSIVESLLPRYGIHRLRLSREKFRTHVFGAELVTAVRRLNFAKWALLRWCSAQLRPQVSTNDDFFGIIYSGTVTKKALAAAISHASPHRVTEICIHPGFPTPSGDAPYPRPGYNLFMSSAARQMEHDALVSGDIAGLIKSRGIVLRGYDGREKPL